MKINTRFNVGDYVYFMNNNKIVSRKITRIDVGMFFDPDVSGLDTTVLYTIIEHGKFEESRLYATKEEVISSLIDDISVMS